jgi:hypothetical protein
MTTESGPTHHGPRPSGAPALYRHRQVAWARLIGLVASLATQGGAFVRDLRQGRRRRALLSLPWSLSLLVSMGLFSWLDTEVTGDALVVSFAGGALRRRIPLAEIESVAVVTVPWYYGWGARLTPRGWLGGAPRGWLYNVWGRRAVALHLRGDRHFAVGSDEAEALLAAIEAARAAPKAA